MPLAVTDLRCEHRRDPLGIGETAPRLSWTLESSARGARQTAWQLLVARSPEALAQGRGDLWDSGRVAGDAQLAVYAGAALTPRLRAWWAVRAWDADGAASPWSAPATFELALGEREWVARWIGIERRGDDERLPLRVARWIRQAAEAPAGGMLQLRRRIELPAGTIASAWLRFVADGKPDAWMHQRPYLVVNGQHTEQMRWLWKMRTPAAWDVLGQLKAGAENVLALQVQRTDGAAMIGLLTVTYADGRVVEVISDTAWEARIAPEPGLGQVGDTTWPTSTEGWGPVVDVGAFGAGPFPPDHIYNRMDKLVPPAVLRGDFVVDKPVARARLYATAAGVYELTLNGGRVGDHELAPGWTEYGKRLQFQTYDVTALLRTGANALAGVVGDGWFSGSQFHGANVHGTEKALRCQLHLTFADGSERVVATDTTWRGATGAIRAADLYHGQSEDATRALTSWRDGAVDPAQWRPVVEMAPAVGPLVPQPDEPARATLTVPPRSIVEHRPGVLIVDFGQNLPGRLRLRLRQPRGTRIRLRHGEMLAKDGTLYVENLRGAKATDEYVCAGGDEVFEPRLTWHGFRYAEITGLAGTLSSDDVVAVVLNSDCPWAGSFHCSDPRLEQLQSNIRWGQRGNFLSIPTDCPQRDERAGWTGDAQIFVRTALYNMACLPFFEKYQQDMVDAQHENGAFPDVAPAKPIENGHFGWGDAGVVVPWAAWQATGDTRILERHLAAMSRWVDHRSSRAKDGLNTEWSYGDWVSPPPQTPHEILGPIYHAWAARIVADCAEAIGRRDEAARCRRVFEEVRAAWAKAHVRPDGRLSSDTQAAYLLALRSGCMPEALREAAGRHLVAAVERAGWHLHTGFLGTGHLLPALSEIGRDDVAFRLLVTDTFPSWLYTVKHGATTMWERWDSYHADLGPQNVGNMNSYNHYAFGAVGEWMYAAIGGIDWLAPGYRRILVRPRHGGVLTHASAEHRCPLGTIATAWRLEPDRFHLALRVPVGAVAEVHVPTRDADRVEEGGKPVSDVPGVRRLRVTADAAVLEVGSGSYSFSAPR